MCLYQINNQYSLDYELSFDITASNNIKVWCNFPKGFEIFSLHYILQTYIANIFCKCIAECQAEVPAQRALSFCL